MLSLKSTYENKVVKLDQPLPDKRSRKVIVTFLEEETAEPGKSKYLTPEDFSFSKAREASADYKGNCSSIAIEARSNTASL